jgi:hypothetical protein
MLDQAWAAVKRGLARLLRGLAERLDGYEARMAAERRRQVETTNRYIGRTERYICCLEALMTSTVLEPLRKQHNRFDTKRLIDAGWPTR